MELWPNFNEKIPGIDRLRNMSNREWLQLDILRGSGTIDALIMDDSSEDDATALRRYAACLDRPFEETGGFFIIPPTEDAERLYGAALRFAKPFGVCPQFADVTALAEMLDGKTTRRSRSSQETKTVRAWIREAQPLIIKNFRDLKSDYLQDRILSVLGSMWGSGSLVILVTDSALESSFFRNPMKQTLIHRLSTKILEEGSERA